MMTTKWLNLGLQNKTLNGLKKNNKTQSASGGSLSPKKRPAQIFVQQLPKLPIGGFVDVCFLFFFSPLPHLKAFCVARSVRIDLRRRRLHFFYSPRHSVRYFVSLNWSTQLCTVCISSLHSLSRICSLILDFFFSRSPLFSTFFFQLDCALLVQTCDVPKLAV